MNTRPVSLCCLMLMVWLMGAVGRVASACSVSAPPPLMTRRARLLISDGLSRVAADFYSCAAFGKRMLFSRWTCVWRSSSNSWSFWYVTTKVLQTSPGIA